MDEELGRILRETPEPMDDHCEACGRKFSEGEMVLTDGTLTAMFGYTFCNQECFEWWLESK
mgnify:CR=1 FL=1